MTSSSDELETLARRVGDVEATLARVATDLADLAAVVAPVTNGDDGGEADAEVPRPAYRSLESVGGGVLHRGLRPPRGRRDPLVLPLG